MPAGAKPPYVKRRGVATPGSIPEALDMFRAEVQFYQQVAPVVGVRVPACYRAEILADGTVLELEDLSAWTVGADRVAASHVLTDLHRRWEGRAERRWPWLRRVGAAADLIGALYDRVWTTSLAQRRGLPPAVIAIGARLVGRVVEADHEVARAGPITLTHGDASTQNLRTGPDGEIALLDWEDVSALPGVLDLAWLLLSSVEPAAWDDVLAAYGGGGELASVLPSGDRPGPAHPGWRGPGLGRRAGLGRWPGRGSPPLARLNSDQPGTSADQCWPESWVRKMVAPPGSQ